MNVSYAQFPTSLDAQIHSSPEVTPSTNNSQPISRERKQANESLRGLLHEYSNDMKARKIALVNEIHALKGISLSQILSK